MTRFTFSPADFVKLLPRLCNIVQSLDQKKQYGIEIKEHRQRRSLDANAYLWVLLDKIAVELSKESPVSPEDVYKQLIPHVGGNSKILPIREDAVDAWKSIWSAGRTGWLCEDMGPCVNLDGYRNIRCFYGSSVYDTRQMSRLIDLAVQEAKQLDIETMTPAELERLKEEWRRPMNTVRGLTATVMRPASCRMATVIVSSATATAITTR